MKSIVWCVFLSTSQHVGSSVSVLVFCFISFLVILTNRKAFIDSKGGRYLQVLAFLNSILLVNQLNQVVVIATGCNSCHFIFDSSSVGVNPNPENGRMPAVCSNLLQKLEEFVTADEKLSKEAVPTGIGSSLLSGSLSMALCCILVGDFTFVCRASICILRMDLFNLII